MTRCVGENTTSPFKNEKEISSRGTETPVYGSARFKRSPSVPNEANLARGYVNSGL